MHYTFSVSSYEDPALEGEVALALDARSSLSFRKRGAGPSEARAPKQESPAGQKRRKLAAIGLFVLGVGVLLYVVSLPQRPKLLQIAGFVLIGLGMIVLPSGKAGEPHATQKSRQKAERLMAALRQNSFIGGLCVAFDDEKMTISTKSRNVEVAYHEISSVIETRDMWFVTYGQAGVVLQKRDLTEGEPNGFLKEIAQLSGCSTEIVRWPQEEEQTTDGSSDAQTTGETL